VGTNAESMPPPWYESGLFWGLTTAALALVLAALTDHNLRWLLWVAWPCTILLAFWLAKRTREFWMIAVLGSALSSAGLFWLYQRLKPPPGQVVMTFKPEQIGTPTPTTSSLPPQVSSKLLPKPKPGGSIRNRTQQKGNGNTANPGLNTGSVKQGPSGVFQNGGSGNVAAPICAPPPRQVNPQMLLDAVRNIQGIKGGIWDDSSTDAERVAIQIRSGLTGWGLRSGGTKSGDAAFFPHGITIEVPAENDSPASEAGVLIQGALKAQGVESEIERNSKFDTTTMRIKVAAQ
jgi:hypothetical protein